MDINYNGDQLDVETLLSNVPISLLEENILTQFGDPSNFRMDYMTQFVESFEYSKQFVEETEEEEELQRLHDEFMNFMKNILQTKLNIGIPEFGEMSNDDKEEITRFTYRFFIINIVENFTNFFYNFIMENKDKLIENVKRRKDLTSQAFKKELSEEDILIIANLSDIMNQILEDDTICSEDFLRLCIGENPVTETTLVNEYFESYVMNGNFVEPYNRMLKLSMKVRIEAGIRNLILKKYRENPALTKEENE